MEEYDPLFWLLYNFVLLKKYSSATGTSSF